MKITKAARYPATTGIVAKLFNEDGKNVFTAHLNADSEGYLFRKEKELLALDLNKPRPKSRRYNDYHRQGAFQTGRMVEKSLQYVSWHCARPTSFSSRR